MPPAWRLAACLRADEDRIMKFSDEVLMAYAQGQLEEPARSEVETAMRTDPVVAARIARYRAVRAHAREACGMMVEERSPPRVAGMGGKVVQLDAVRAARQQAQQPVPMRSSRWSWRQWAVLAAALAIGACEGVFAYHLMQGESSLSVDAKGGMLVARGALAQALSTQLSGADGKARVGTSFVSKEGSYCRSFVIGGAGGLACRDGERWHIAVLAETGQDNEVSKPVRDMIAQRIDGAPLDQQAERAAVAVGWRR
jgi:hypothetical protein